MDDPTVWDSVYFWKQAEENNLNVFWRTWKSCNQEVAKPGHHWALAKLQHAVLCDNIYFYKHTGNVYFLLLLPVLSPFRFSAQLLFKTFCFICLQFLRMVENLWFVLTCSPVVSVDKSAKYLLWSLGRKQPLLMHTIQGKIRNQIKKNIFFSFSDQCNFAHTIYSAAHCVQTMTMGKVRILYFLLRIQFPFPSSINYFGVNSYSTTDESPVAGNET